MRGRGYMRFLIFVMSFILFGCNGNDDWVHEQEPDTCYLCFSPGIMNTEITRSVPQAILGAKFTESVTPYEFGMWICRHDESNHTNFIPYISWMENMQAYYIEGTSNIRDAWYFEYENDKHNRIGIRTGESVDIYAYYPYIEGQKDLESVRFESGAYDLMWADPVAGVDTHITDPKDNPDHIVNVGLNFHHALTCIQIDIICEYSSSMKLTELTIHDSNPDATQSKLYKGGYINIMTGEVTCGDSDKCSDLTLKSPNPKENLNTPIIQKTTTPIYIMIPEVDGYTNNQFYLTFKFDNKASPSRFYLTNSFLKQASEKDASATQEIKVEKFEKGKIYRYQLNIDNEIRFNSVDINDSPHEIINTDFEI